METIFKSGYSKILRLFYQNRHANIHLRDLARKAILNENSATRFLQQLEKESILKSTREGNLKKYSLQKNSKAFLILSSFDLERFNQLPSLRRRAIALFLNNLEEKPVMVLLFGSTAKGTYQENSDIDLLLIVNQKIKLEMAARFADAQTGITINAFQITYRNFLQELKMKKDKVIASAIESGYPIANHLLFYEVFFQ